MNYIFMAIFIAIYLVGAVSMVYQLYKTNGLTYNKWTKF